MAVTGARRKIRFGHLKKHEKARWQKKIFLLLAIIMQCFCAVMVFPAAVEEMQRAAEQGDATVQAKLGAGFFRQEGDANARPSREKATAQNQSAAQRILGVMSAFGPGGPQSHAAS